MPLDFKMIRNVRRCVEGGMTDPDDIAFVLDLSVMSIRLTLLDIQILGPAPRILRLTREKRFFKQDIKPRRPRKIDPESQALLRKEFASKPRTMPTRRWFTIKGREYNVGHATIRRVIYRMQTYSEPRDVRAASAPTR